MPRRLPPLSALRAFEAAARHLSFTDAAKELLVTQAAVSHQVRALEEFLGVALFQRLTRKVVLTEAGQTLFPAIAESLDRIADAIRALPHGEIRSRLVVGVTAYMSAKWLIPRLGRFSRRHPGIDVHLHHSFLPIDFSKEEVDIAVQWGDGNWAGLLAEPLIRFEYTPICSPKLLKGPRALRTPEDLRRHILLHDIDHHCWLKWLETADVEAVDGTRGEIFDDYNVLLYAVAAGRGVGIGSTELVADEVRSGRLATPFPITVKPDYAYYVVYPKDGLRRPEARQFRDWIVMEASTSPDAVTNVTKPRAGIPRRSPSEPRAAPRPRRGSSASGGRSRNPSI